MAAIAERPRVDLRHDLIHPLPSQQQFLEAMWRYVYLLFGGAAGPGKSHILRWALLELLTVWALRDRHRHVTVGLFCEDYPSLKDRHITKIKREFPPWLGELSDTQADGLGFRLREEYGGGFLALRNLDDPAKYASAEFAAIAVDELTKNPRQTFDDLRFRKRWPGIEHSPFLAASNPGSIGHAWVKKLWVDRDFSGDDEELDPETFLFIPAKAKENPYLPQSYWDTLHSLPPLMRKAMEEGNWDLFVGQYFSDWNRDLHVCAPFPIPGNWRKLIGIDYGWEKPTAVGWWAIDPNDQWWLYRELYERQLTYPVLGREVMERTLLDELIYMAIADPSIWGDRQRHEEQPGQTGGEILHAIFEKRDITLVRGNHDRLQGWQRCRQLLMPMALPDGKQGSRLHVFSTCANFIRTIPSLVHDPVRAEDLDTNGEDHHADAWRYAVNTKAELTREEESLEAYQNVAAEMPINYGIGFGG